MSCTALPHGCLRVCVVLLPGPGISVGSEEQEETQARQRARAPHLTSFLLAWLSNNRMNVTDSPGGKHKQKRPVVTTGLFCTCVFQYHAINVPILPMPSADEQRQQLFEELKNRILVVYEIQVEPETGSVRPDLLQDTEEQKRLFDVPEINELLHQIVDLDPDADDQVQKGKTFEHLMQNVLEAAIHQLVNETEGLGQP